MDDQAGVWGQYDDLRTELAASERVGPQAQLIGAEDLEGADRVVFLEGEVDRIEVEQAQIARVVPVSIICPTSLKEPLDALKPHAEALLRVNHFVLAYPPASDAAREALARQLGRHRCSLVAWPEWATCMADVARKYGSDGIQALIEAAEPYPIEGLQRIKPGLLKKLRSRPPPPVMSTGVESLDAVLSLPTEGRLIVITGFPNHGKTSLVRHLMVHTARAHARRWAVFSPESHPWEHFIAQCAEVYTGRPFYPRAGWQRMDDAEMDDAEAFLARHVTMLLADDQKGSPTIEWLLERAELAVLRDGVTDALIDPWNGLDHIFGGRSETDYIGHALLRLLAFARRYGCNVWVVAHPAKPAPLKPGQKREAPGPYDISGSSHWANKTDLGLTVHGDDPSNVGVHLWKSRLLRWGTRNKMAQVEFVPETGRYFTPGKHDEAESVQQDWIG